MVLGFPIANPNNSFFLSVNFCNMYLEISCPIELLAANITCIGMCCFCMYYFMFLSSIGGLGFEVTVFTTVPSLSMYTQNMPPQAFLGRKYGITLSTRYRVFSIMKFVHVTSIPCLFYKDCRR